MNLFNPDRIMGEDNTGGVIVQILIFQVWDTNEDLAPVQREALYGWFQQTSGLWAFNTIQAAIEHALLNEKLVQFNYRNNRISADVLIAKSKAELITNEIVKLKQ